MKRLSISLIMTVMTLSIGVFSTGCAVMLLGSGAAGGYSISQDEVEGFFDRKYDSVWDASTEVLREEGIVTLEDKAGGKVEGEVEKAKITVHIDRATEKTVRLRVKARKFKNLFPDIDRAQALFNRIVAKVG